MTRKQEIKEMADYKASCITSDKDMQPAFADVFRMGAEWADAHPDIDVRTMAAWRGGYKEAIEKACEWLKDFIKWNDLCTLEDIEQFRKAMKGD